MAGAMKSPNSPCSHISSPRILKPPSCCLVWPFRQPKAMNSLWLTKSGAGRQEESKGESSSLLAGVGVEVEGPVLMSLIDNSEIAGGRGGNVAGSGGLDGACGEGLDRATVVA